MTKVKKKIQKKITFGQSFPKKNKNFKPKKLIYNTKKIDYYGDIKITTMLNPPLTYFTPTEDLPDFYKETLPKNKKRILEECLQETFPPPHNGEQIKLINKIYDKMYVKISEILWTE